MPGKKIEWDGVVYPSLKACAEALGITVNALYRLRARGHTSSDTVLPFVRPITYRGMEFDSQQDLAEYMGYSDSWVSRHRQLGDIEDYEPKR